MQYLKSLNCTPLNQISAWYKNFCLKLNSDKINMQIKKKNVIYFSKSTILTWTIESFTLS